MTEARPPTKEDPVSEYGLQVLMAMGVMAAFVVAAVAVRAVMWAIVSLLWPGGDVWTPPRAAGRLR